MAEQAAALHEVVDQLSRVEERLMRLLVSGWRQAGAEATALQSEADALAELGLEELAARFRAVATAASVESAMLAIALALASSRLLRARVPCDAPPGEGWKPLVPTRKGKEVSATRLAPVGRIALGEGEVWACIRLQGAFVSEWLLIEPPALEPPAEASHSRAGLTARLLRGRGRGQSQSDDGSGGSPWLRQRVEGHLRWRARYPLGASGDVRLCELVDPRWSPPPEKTDDHLGSLRRAMVSGKLKAGQPALGYGGALQAVELDSAESASYAWADSAEADAFRNSAVGRIWALAWVDKGLIAPLVLFALGGALRQPQLLHLVPGCPREVLRS